MKLHVYNGLAEDLQAAGSSLLQSLSSDEPPQDILKSTAYSPLSPGTQTTGSLVLLAVIVFAIYYLGKKR